MHTQSFLRYICGEGLGTRLYSLSCKYTNVTNYKDRIQNRFYAAPERQCELPEGPEKEEAEEDRPKQNHTLGQRMAQLQGGGDPEGRGGGGERRYSAGDREIHCSVWLQSVKRLTRT